MICRKFTGVCARVVLILLIGFASSAAHAGGVVSLNFDDGYIDGYNQAWRLEKAGFRATFYPHTSEIGEPGHMTWQDLRTLAVNRHEVSLHSVTHSDLTIIPLEQMQLEILNSRNAFTQQKLKPHSFAYPFGEYNQNVINEVKKAGLLFARGADSYDLNSPASSRWALYSLSVTVHTATEELINFMERAMVENKWFIIVIHEVKENPKPGRDYTITPAFLQQIINLLAQMHIPVRTNLEASCIIYKVGCNLAIQ